MCGLWLLLESHEQAFIHRRNDTQKYTKGTIPPKSNLVVYWVHWSYIQERGWSKGKCKSEKPTPAQVLTFTRTAFLEHPVQCTVNPTTNPFPHYPFLPIWQLISAYLALGSGLVSIKFLSFPEFDKICFFLSRPCGPRPLVQHNTTVTKLLTLWRLHLSSKHILPFK